MKMEKNNRRKRKYIATPIQKKLLFLIFASAIVPTAVVAASFYYLVFNLLAQQLGIPEAIAYNLIPVLKKMNFIIAVALPIVLFIIWKVALELSHRIAGPLYRIEKELDDRINGKAQGEIKLRPKDEFKLLVEKINKIIAKK